MTSLPAVARVSESRWRSLLNDVICGEPMMMRTIDSRAQREAMARLQPERFDAVVAYRCDFAHVAGVLGHRNLILDIDDPEHIRRREAARWTDNGDAAWQRALDLRRLKRFEINCARQAKACFVCQPRDAEPFEQVGVKPIVVPNCVEVPEVCPPRRATTPSVLFLGNMEGSMQSPNVDAMFWLVKEIWPLIRRELPQAECWLSGQMRGSWRAEASKIEGVRVLGFVDDLSALLQSASVSIAPIRFGTGTRIKILEAMAGGCPVVSTTKGCEGIEAVGGRDLLVSDGAADFASACVGVLREPKKGSSLGHAGWQAVMDRYNRIKREQWLADVFNKLIGLSAALPAAPGGGV